MCLIWLLIQIVRVIFRMTQNILCTLPINRKQIRKTLLITLTPICLSAAVLSCPQEHSSGLKPLARWHWWYPCNTPTLKTDPCLWQQIHTILHVHVLCVFHKIWKSPVDYAHNSTQCSARWISLSKESCPDDPTETVRHRMMVMRPLYRTSQHRLIKWCQCSKL